MGTEESGIRHDGCGFVFSIDADHAVEDQPTVCQVECDGTGTWISGAEGAYLHGIAIAEGWGHAGSACSKGNRGFFLQKVGDEHIRIWYEFYIK